MPDGIGTATDKLGKTFIGSQQDFFGIPHAYVKPQDAETPPVDNFKVSPAKEFRIESSLSKRSLPSNQAWRMDSFVGRVVNFFEQSVFLLRKIWPNRPPEIDQKLMASLHGNRVAALYPGLQQAPISQVLKYTLKFLKKQKGELTPPKEILKSLARCASISSKLDRMATLANHQSRAKRLTSLCQGLSKSILSLPIGESIFLPGGWKQMNEMHSAFYEIKKNPSGTFSFRIISRDLSLHSQSVISGAGKEKIYPHTVFNEIKGEEIADPVWLHALLRLQLPGGEKPLKERKETSNESPDYFATKLGSLLGIPQKSEMVPNFSSLKGLLAPFASRIEKPTSDFAAYCSGKAANTSHKDVWMLVDMARKELKGPVGEIKRRKLHLQVNTLFEFFASTKSGLRSNQTNQILLEEGIQNVTALASLMHSTKQLTDAEIAHINTQCTVIAQAVAAAKNPKTRLSTRNPFILTAKLTSYPFNKPSAQIKPFDPTNLCFTKIEAVSGEKLTEELSEAALKMKVEAQVNSEISSVEVSTVTKLLEATKTECEALKAAGNESQLQLRIKDLFYSLPLDKVSDSSPPSPLRYKFIDSFWQQLTSEELVACSLELGALSKLLIESTERTNSNTPACMLLMIKVGILQEHLARFNHRETKLEGNVGLAFWTTAYEIFTDDESPHSNYMGYVPVGIRKYSAEEKELSQSLAKYFRIVSSGRSYKSGEYRSAHLGKTRITTHSEGVKQEWVEHNVQRPSAFFPKKNGLHPQLIAYENQTELFQKFFPVQILNKKQFSLSASEEAQAVWNRRYQYACLRAVALRFRLGKTNTKQRRYFDENFLEHTEEAIRDNPEKILMDFQKLLKFHPKEESSSLPPLPKKDLADLLCVLNKKCLVETLGLIKQKPYLLDLPDVRSLLESINVNGSTEGLKASNHVVIKAIIDQYEVFKNQGNIHRTLFMVNFMRNLKQMDSELVFPDCSSLLREWAYMSLDSNKPEFQQRHTIWMQYMLSFEEKDVLTGQEAAEFLKGAAALHMSPAEVYDFDPLLQKRWQLLKEKWKIPLQTMFESPDAVSLIKHTLDSICKLAQAPLPEGSWEGSFPVYTAGAYQINVLEGSLINIKGGWSTRSLPVEVRGNSDVTTALSQDKLETITAKFSQKGQDGYFSFSDKQNNPTCIVSTGKEERVYKEIEIPVQQDQKEKIWLQFVSKEALFPRPKKNEVKFDYPNLMVILVQIFRNVRNSNKVENAPKLPGFLDLPNYRFWVDSKNPSKTFVLDEDGTPLFQIIFKDTVRGRVIVSIIDLREGVASKKKTVGELNPKMHPIWQELNHLDSPGNIMVWKEGKRIEKVELTRYQLSFVEKEGKAVCCDPRLNGWLLENGPSAKLIQKGLPTALVLRHPTIASQFRVVVPNKKIEMRADDLKLNYRMLYRLIKGLIFGKVVSLHGKDPMANDWRLVTSSKQDFWIFDADPASLAFTEVSGTSIKPYLYLASLSLISHNPERSLEFLLRMNAFQGKIDHDDFDELKTYLDRSIPTPDGIALQLHAAIIGRRKTIGKQKSHFEAEIGRLYKQYLACAGKITGNLRLEGFNEAISLFSIAPDEDFFKAHAPLLVNPNGHRTMEAKQIHRPFFQPFVRGKNKITDYVEFLLENSQGKFPETSYDFSSRNLKQLGVHFFQMYDIASSHELGSSTFKMLDFSLRSLPIVERPAVEGEDVPEHLKEPSIPQQEFFELLHNYLTRVIEIRRRKTVLPLPKPPELKMLPTPKRRESISDNERNAIEDFNKKTIGEFLQILEKAVTDEEADYPPAKEDPVVTFEAVFDKKIFKNDIEEKIKAIVKNNPKILHEESPLEHLEKALEEQKPQLQPISLDATLGHALYQKEELKQFFKEDQTPNLLPEIDLTDLKHAPKESLKTAAEELDTEVSEAKKLLSVKKNMQFIQGEESRKLLEKHLEGKRKGFVEKQEQLRQSILKLVEEKRTAAHLIHQQAKLIKSVDLEILLKHFLQNDLERLAGDLPKDISFENLKSALGNYLLVSTDMQRMDTAWEEAKALSTEKEGMSPIAISNLYQFLIDVRQYNPSQNPHLLLFEYMTNLLLRENQIKMVQDFLEDPDCVRQAVTGAGKTTVILVLLALMQANGTNLVTVNFPKHLLEDNLNDFQKKLGKIFQKSVYPLKFNMSTPTAIPHPSDEGEYISVFEKMYEDFLKVILDKGVVVSTLESQQALEQKWIRLMDQQSKLPPEAIDPLEKKHLEYLTKILALKARSEYTILDEHDKALNQREERHLKIGEGEPIPAFLWKTSLEVYDLLLAEPELGLQRNVQGELLNDEQRYAILQRVAEKIAEQWVSLLGVPTHQKVAFIKDFTDYILGVNENLLPQLNGLTFQELDVIAVLKDQFYTFLPLTLSKTCNVRYIRSKDNVHTVPCLAGDIPRESSDFEQILERINYTIQDHYQTGEKEGFIRQWIQDRKNQAEAAVLNEIYATVEETPESALFEKYFPGRKLSSLLQSQIPELVAEINKDPKRIRGFLELTLRKMEITTGKISCDGHNLVSMSKHTCGASATGAARTSVLAFPASMNTKEAADKGATGKMVLGLLMKNRAADGSLPPVRRYNPEFPQEIIPGTIKQDPNFQIVVDGCGVAALHGLPFGLASQQLLNHQPKEGAIKGILVGNEGSCQKVHTRKGIVSPEVSGLKPSELGGFIDECRARGSDFKMAPNTRALITANEKQLFEEVLQTVGRLRREDQTFFYSAPELDSVSDAVDLIKQSLKNSVERGSDDLYRSKKHELRDIVRHEMIHELLSYAGKNDTAGMLQRYKDFADKDILISFNKMDLSIPGSYFDANHKINKMDKNPVQELETLRQRHLQTATEVNLTKAVERLNGLTYSEEVLKHLPSTVYGVSTPLLDQEVEVETETEVEVETEAESEVDATQEMKDYLPWLRYYDQEFEVHSLGEIHSAYDPLLSCTENFLPLGRKKRGTAAKWHREAHDAMQNPVHGIQFSFDSYYYLKQPSALNNVLLLDTAEYEDGSPICKKVKDSLGDDFLHGKQSLYDLRLKKFITGDFAKPGAVIPESIKNKLDSIFAQVRFFNGEFNQYAPAEAKALEEWLAKNNPEKMESYFKNVILKHRADEKLSYSFSPLCKLFKKLKTNN